jgi:hypothetical protein
MDTIGSLMHLVIACVVVYGATILYHFTSGDLEAIASIADSTEKEDE